VVASFAKKEEEQIAASFDFFLEFVFLDFVLDFNNDWWGPLGSKGTNLSSMQGSKSCKKHLSQDTLQ